MSVPPEQQATVNTEPAPTLAPETTITVNAIVTGPAEGVAFIQKALDGLAMAAAQEGVTIAGLGNVNKLETIFLAQNQLDERLGSERRLVYPQDLEGTPDDIIREWLFDVRTNADATNFTWMNFFIEGALQAYLDGRIARERLEDMVYGVWMNQIGQAIIHEAVELQASTDWKHWKNPRGVDRPNVGVELTDILHFDVSAAIKSKKTPADFFAAYKAKNTENHARQDGTVEGREDYQAAPALQQPIAPENDSSEGDQ